MKKVLIVLVLIVVVGLAIVLGLGYFMGGDSSVPKNVILEVDFETGVVEYVPMTDPFAALTQAEVTVTRDVVEALAQASSDERVVALVAHIGSGNMGFAQLQDVRQAVVDFGASGKPTVAWSETFGEVSPGNGGYYLASAFDEIHLQPSGDVNLTGLMFEGMFLKGAFEKLGMVPQMDHRYEYKNAMNTFTEESFTEPHREAMETLMSSLFDHMVDDMAEGRGMEASALRQLIDGGPFYGEEAVTQGLVDRLSYRDEVYDGVREKVGGDSELLFLNAYLERAGRPNDSGKGVALIYGVGGIARGASQYNAFNGSTVMGSDTVTAAFRAAIEDDSIEAILFRIDCNGGSYVASDAVWRHVALAREAGKPVVASFGNVAASGGYFVAMGADKIVAQPGTITGSIGVLGGKFVMDETWSKLGITWDEVHTSGNASMWSANHAYSEEEWARHQTWLDRVYDDFTSKAAAGRGMDVEELRKVAKGRVWTGADAKELGLVDALGGFGESLDLIREALGETADASLDLEVFPKAKSPWDELFGPGPQSSEVAALTMLRFFEQVRPVMVMAQKAGLLGPPPVQTLSYPEEWVPRP